MRIRHAESMLERGVCRAGIALWQSSIHMTDSKPPSTSILLSLIEY